MHEVLTRQNQATGKIYRVYSNRSLPKKSNRGEYFYVLSIKTKGGRRIKIGTTDDMNRRMYEHLGKYKTDIIICWISPHYSKYTTIRVEDRTREIFKTYKDWEFIRNDRFNIPKEVVTITVKVKKEWVIKIIDFPAV